MSKFTYMVRSSLGMIEVNKREEHAEIRMRKRSQRLNQNNSLMLCNCHYSLPSHPSVLIIVSQVVSSWARRITAGTGKY